MKTKWMLICTMLAALFLSGCADHSLTSATQGMTYQQLVDAKRGDKEIWFKNVKYYCWSCEGSPTRVYSDKAGNKVAVWLYYAGYDYPARCEGGGDGYGGYAANCTPAFSQCLLEEQHFEFKNNVVIRAWWHHGWGPKRAPYADACSNIIPVIPGGEDGGD